MTGTASEIVEGYLKRLRSELEQAGASDTDDLVAEIRSLLAEAAGDDSDTAEAETARLGDPAELARGIMAERGLDASAGMSTGVWWRLGLAAPIDLAIGLALPVAASLPLYAVARFGQPRGASIAIAAVLGVLALAWPFFVWRPWRRGGRGLSPGMSLTGLAVVRAPGFWRLVRIEELRAMGLAPRRRVAISAAIALVSAVLLAGAAVVGLDIGSSWLASATIDAQFSAATIGGDAPLAVQLQGVTDQVYTGLMGAPWPEASTAAPHVAPEAASAMQPLWQKIEQEKVRVVRIGTPVELTPGVYRFDVKEYRDDGTAFGARVGSSTFTVGRRQWLTGSRNGSDWVVVKIEVGPTTGK